MNMYHVELRWIEGESSAVAMIKRSEKSPTKYKTSKATINWILAACFMVA